MRRRYIITCIIFILLGMLMMFPDSQMDHDNLVSDSGLPYPTGTDPYHFMYKSITDPYHSLYSFVHSIFPSFILTLIFPMFAYILTLTLTYHIIKEQTRSKRWAIIGMAFLGTIEMYVLTTYPGYMDTISLNHVFLLSMIYISMRQRLSLLFALIPLLFIFRWHWQGYFIGIIILMFSSILRGLYMKRYWSVFLTSIICMGLSIPYWKHIISYMSMGRYTITQETQMIPYQYKGILLVIMVLMFITYSWHYRSDRYNMRLMPLSSYFLVLLIPALLMHRFYALLIVPLALMIIISSHSIEKIGIFRHMKHVIILLCIVQFCTLSYSIHAADPHDRVLITDDVLGILSEVPENVSVYGAWEAGTVYRYFRPDLDIIWHNAEPVDKKAYLDYWLCTKDDDNIDIVHPRMFKGLKFSENLSTCRLDCFSRAFTSYQGPVPSPVPGPVPSPVP